MQILVEGLGIEEIIINTVKVADIFFWEAQRSLKLKQIGHQCRAAARHEQTWILNKVIKYMLPDGLLFRQNVLIELLKAAQL